MYLRVISRDTIDSLIGSNRKLCRSYGTLDPDPADMDAEKEAFVGWTLNEGGAMGVPWKEDSKMEALDREAVRVEAMVAMKKLGKLRKYPEEKQRRLVVSERGFLSQDEKCGKMWGGI
ncbi:hypothetical protein PanWU01x14_145660 [Parasponia andersonii]|uniref:Uncharacterized protein n=1 Tax=Parasponia andersonii TaxID=3476 RepID=A0A2P5CKA6_PARAD|nr:hypothetical protein PanWU01x14_145660 [Parasponia andersonii]